MWLVPRVNRFVGLVPATNWKWTNRWSAFALMLPFKIIRDIQSMLCKFNRMFSFVSTSLENTRTPFCTSWWNHAITVFSGVYNTVRRNVLKSDCFENDANFPHKINVADDLFHVTKFCLFCSGRRRGIQVCLQVSKFVYLEVSNFAAP